MSNNSRIEKRALADVLFVITEKPEMEEYEFWISNKLGMDKRLVKRFSKEIDWRIDVYNQKIFFLHPIENGVEVEAFSWED